MRVEPHSRIRERSGVERRENREVVPAGGWGGGRVRDEGVGIPEVVHVRMGQWRLGEVWGVWYGGGDEAEGDRSMKRVALFVGVGYEDGRISRPGRSLFHRMETDGKNERTRQ